MQAVAIVEVLAQVLMGKGSGTRGITTDGRVYKEIASEQGMDKIGEFI